MKQILTIALSLSGFFAFGQLTPRVSPQSKVEQKVGFTDISVSYSRPNVNERVIFGDMLPYGEIWRTGANENTIVSISDVLIFGKDTLNAGKYYLYTKPEKDSWTIYFYKTTDNWGTPDTWEESNIALKVVAKVETQKTVLETFTIDFQNIESRGANLVLAWEKVRVEIPFTVNTDAKIKANITKVMAGPSAADLNNSAKYYYDNKMDLKKALEWSTKAVELRPEAYWMYLTKAQIQLELGDKTAAIETAKKGKELAEKEKDNGFISSFDKIIGK
ncbi:MAG: DUF2911 domain-containing protein [Fluviicola sp.]